MLTCVGVRKARQGDPQGTIELLWRRQAEFARTVDRHWQRVMNPSAQRFRRRVTTGELTASKIDGAFRAMTRDALRFGNSPELEAEIRDAMRDAYIVGAIYIAERDAQIRRRGKRPAQPSSIRVNKAGPAEIVAGFNLSLADEKAIRELGNTGVLWFRDVNGAPYFDATAQKAIRDDALELVARGKDAGQVAKQLADKAEAMHGVGRFADRGRTYWGGVAEHAATTAGIRGQLSQLVSLGWERYEIINPMDERTTDICQYMNGKTVFVSAGVAEVNAVAGETTPDGVRSVKPFVPGGSSQAVIDVLGRGAPRAGAGDFSASQSQQLSRAGFAAPPYHFRCRSWVDIAHLPGDPIPQLGPHLVEGLERPVGPTAAELAAEHKKQIEKWIKKTYKKQTGGSVPVSTFNMTKLRRGLKSKAAKTEAQIEQFRRRGAYNVRYTSGETAVRTELNGLLAEYEIASTDAMFDHNLAGHWTNATPEPAKRAGLAVGDIPASKWQDSKGIAHGSRGYYHTSDDLLMGDSARAFHDGSGRIIMGRQAHEGAVAFVEGARDSHAVNGMKTLVHESLHGATNAGVYTYSGIGKPIEEVTTEMTARHIMAHKFGRTELVDYTHRGSYQTWINRTRIAIGKAIDDVPEIDAYTGAQATHDVLRAGALKFKQAPVKTVLATSDDMLVHFVKSVPWPESALTDSTGEALTGRARMARVRKLRTALTRRMRDEFP